jgi:hypothetical protein
MEEPSLLDYLKEKLSLRRLFKHEEGTPSVASEEIPYEPEVDVESEHKPIFFIRFSKLPWRTILALFFALIAQSSLEPPAQNSRVGIFLYVVAAFFLVFALLKKEWIMTRREEMVEKSIGLGVRTIPMFLFIPLIFISFLSFKDNRFTAFNVTIWVLTLISGLAAFWEPEKLFEWPAIKSRISSLFKGNPFTLKIDFWKLLVLAVFLISAWFHLYQLNSIPINMTSDHTEKLLDVNGVLNGTYQIFFPNNGGREPIHFYLAALFIKVLHTGLTFFTLKLTMAFAFLLSLIYVYRLGKEVGNRWTGLFFMALLGFSSWVNMITRVGLRLVLTPVFVAPVLFYLFRGLRTSRRNDFILAGILTGLGLLGYSAFRVMPIVVVLGVVIFLAYQKFNRTSRNTWWALGLLALFALVLFLPLFRFAIQYPEVIGFRTLTRMTSAEQKLPADVIKVFLSNFWNAITMTFWKDGSTWVISIPGRPALDIISAALYFMGLILMVYRWLRSRRWQDLVLLISIPILMLPSILSLAFPDENPSLSRAGGAVIPIVLICAIALETLLSSLWKKSSHLFGKICVVILGLGLLGFSAAQNYDIALVQYPDEYAKATWNTTQMGDVAREFIQLTGKPDNVWVVGVPYWVDTRLVAISAGYIGKDYAIWPKDIDSTLAITGPKLFIVKFDDQEGMDKLKADYPRGFAELHSNAIDGRNFYAYIVPPG